MPVQLLPLLLGLGSTLANTVGARQRDNSIAQTMNAERVRQKKFDDDAFAANARAKSRYDDTAGGAADRATELSDLYTGAVAAEPTKAIAALPQSDSNIVLSSDAAGAERSTAEAGDEAQRRAKFKGFGDYFGDISRGVARDAGEVGMISSFKRGSQSVLPSELEAAQQKGAKWMMLGDLLNAGAGIAGGGGLKGLLGGGGVSVQSGTSTLRSLYPGVR